MIYYSADELSACDILGPHTVLGVDVARGGPEDEHTGDKKLDKIVYKCTEVHHPRIPRDEAETGTGRPDPDSWLIVKDLTSNSCAVLARKPINKDVVILTSFKGYVTGGKAMKDMVAAECGCEKGCTWELPR